ncbi:MAG: putative membrane protein YhiD involved in acid resistance [Myxococcota bacterium]
MSLITSGQLTLMQLASNTPSPFTIDFMGGDAADPVQLALQSTASVLVAVVLSVIVALVYRSTHRGVQYSASFALTLVMLAAVGTLVMMVIGDSLARAFGVFGALSLVRFRTAVKDPKDIAYVFLVLAIGMAAGTGRFLVAVSGSGVILIVVAILSKLKFGSKVRDEYLLRMVYGGAATVGVPAALAELTRRTVLLTISGFDGDRGVEATYLVSLKGDIQSTVTTLQQIEGVTDVHLTATAEEIEL